MVGMAGKFCLDIQSKTLQQGTNHPCITRKVYAVKVHPEDVLEITQTIDIILVREKEPDRLKKDSDVELPGNKR